MNFHPIYSKVKPNQLLHATANALEVDTNRVDISSPDEFLQASIVPLSLGKVIPPHIHELRHAPSSESTITQESWVVVRGSIRITLFDLDRTFLYEGDLLPGCVLVTYNGGHSLECLEKDTVILEFKNGPYLGRDFQTFSKC